MAIRAFTARDAVHEQTDSEYECTFVEAAPGQAPLIAAAILTINATLRDVATNAVINGRDAQNVKNTNGGTLGMDCRFVLQLSSLDNIIVGEGVGGGGVEKHRLTLEVTYSHYVGGPGHLTHEATFFVLKLADVS